MLLLSIHINGWALESFANNPMLGPSSEALLQLGAKDSFLIINKGEFWRLISPVVLHAGFVHYVINIVALSAIGTAVEISHGTAATAVIFLLSAIGGNILSAIFLPAFITIGASGGVFGLLGACLADITMHWHLIFNDYIHEQRTNENYSIIAWLAAEIILNCLIGLTPLVDNFTHVGGLIYGFFGGIIAIQQTSTEYLFPQEHDHVICKAKVKKYSIIIFSIITKLLY